MRRLYLKIYFTIIASLLLVVWLLAAHGLAAIWKAVVGTLPRP